MSNASLDAYVHRFQNLPSLEIPDITAKGEIKAGITLTGEQLASELIIGPDLKTQVELLSVQVAYWGQVAARCRRAWEIVERDFRVWKAHEYIKRATSDDPKFKKPSDTLIDHETRTLPDYSRWYALSEKMEESHNAATAILEGFRAKRDLMKVTVYRSHEDGAARLSV